MLSFRGATGRSPVGPQFQAPPPAALAQPFFPRAPTQMVPQQQGGGPAAIYPPQFGYWYPPDFQYQQALANPQVLQNYLAQMYGMTSPAPPPFNQYMGYMPSPAPPTPSAVFPPAPAPQVAAQALVHHPTPPQIQGPFLPVPSLPQNFRLQLPPHAVSILPPSTAGLFFRARHNSTFVLQLVQEKKFRITYGLLVLKLWQICSHLLRPPPRLGRQAQAVLRLRAPDGGQPALQSIGFNTP
ncbi:hypothetical protein PR202_ga17705 [Eleusine coracana subsp. coracana]|uniref:Uncharacterized protein n=1 Tax=Eleusine coracana subsp. coracana TaxID=191504 RepID=A0AAV5CR49_ELECO|nr:hypothetical protein PR202_ga17458 [Eleusine coracana subsp. coracana]GJN00516.1 hypothetical protein PR202_ga17705 [Eleusine coracana subsp. coracana]